MIDKSDIIEYQVHELYAHFGLAYFYSEVLHRGLCNILALFDLPRKDLITRPRIEEKLSYAFSLTLGQVISELSDKLSTKHLEMLEKLLEHRNFIAHHFWFDCAHLMFKSEDILKLIIQLDSYSELFCEADNEITKIFHRRQVELGITDELVEDCLEKIIAGDCASPLPDKSTSKELMKKFKKTQCLVQVWEFKDTDGEIPLIFEIDDGTLWQFCDVGLGWTKYQKIEPHWKAHPALIPYLPTNISLRPIGAKPWDYEFKLKDGATLWVKPGSRPKTFKWGIRLDKTK